MEERMQRYRQQMDTLRTYITSGFYGTDVVSPSARRNIRNGAKTHFLEGDSLMYVGDTKRGPRQVVTEVEEASDILKRYHTTPLGSHTGINATADKVSRKYWWTGMKTDVQDFVSSCEECRDLHKWQKTQSQATVMPAFKGVAVEVAEPLDLVGINLIGPLPMTTSGNQYVLSMTDHFTKFVELFALPQKEPISTSKCIKTFINRWGAPKWILSDQGSTFCNKVNQELCILLNINKSVISAYQSEINKLDERSNQTTKTLIRKLSEENEERWDEVLDDVTFSLRTKKETSTTYSPFFRMFGRHPRMSNEIEEAEDDVDIIPFIRDKEREPYVQSREKKTTGRPMKIQEAEDDVDRPVIREKEREAFIQSREKKTTGQPKRIEEAANDVDIPVVRDKERKAHVQSCETITTGQSKRVEEAADAVGSPVITDKERQAHVQSCETITTGQSKRVEKAADAVGSPVITDNEREAHVQSRETITTGHSKRVKEAADAVGSPVITDKERQAHVQSCETITTGQSKRVEEAADAVGSPVITDNERLAHVQSRETITTGQSKRVEKAADAVGSPVITDNEREAHVQSRETITMGQSKRKAADAVGRPVIKDKERQAHVQSREKNTTGHSKRIEEIMDDVGRPVIRDEEREAYVQSREKNMGHSKRKKDKPVFKFTNPVKTRRGEHCVCRQIRDDRKCWRCTICDEWFHPLCLGMDEKKKPKGNFYCLACS